MVDGEVIGQSSRNPVLSMKSPSSTWSRGWSEGKLSFETKQSLQGHAAQKLFRASAPCLQGSRPTFSAFPSVPKGRFKQLLSREARRYRDKSGEEQPRNNSVALSTLVLLQGIYIT